MRGRTTCIMEYEGLPRAQVLTNQIQVIQGGQTFEGRVYLIGLESDMGLSRGGGMKRVATCLISIPAESEHCNLQLLSQSIVPNTV